MRKEGKKYSLLIESVLRFIQPSLPHPTQHTPRNIILLQRISPYPYHSASFYACFSKDQIKSGFQPSSSFLSPLFAPFHNQSSPFPQLLSPQYCSSLISFAFIFYFSFFRLVLFRFISFLFLLLFAAHLNASLPFSFSLHHFLDSIQSCSLTDPLVSNRILSNAISSLRDSSFPVPASGP